MNKFSEMSWFDTISDDVLLHILLYVPRRYWKHLKLVSRRFSNVCSDKEIFRHSNLECAYGMSEKDLQDYLRNGTAFIETLNLNHCAWYSSTVLSTFIARCKKIQELYLLDCKLTTKGLSRILCSLDCVKTLVLTVQNLLEFSNEINCNLEVQHSLRNLQHFGLHIREESNGNVHCSLQFHLSQQTTIVEYCPNLESFFVIGQPGSSQRLSKRLIHPLIVKTQNMSNLKTMSINSTNDATSRLYFFGVLVKAFEAGVHFKNLSVSGLDLKQAVKKSYFIRSLKESCPTLENLDLSKVHIDELEASITIDDAPCLKYLNLSDIRSESNCLGLMKIASRCPNLVSLNLRGATSGHRHWTEDTISNFDQLLSNCPNLRHINLTGIHVHGTGASRSLISVIASHQMKGLKNIALPLCCLVQPIATSDTAKQPGFITKGFGKRQRIARQLMPSTSATTDSDESLPLAGELTTLQQACPEVTSLELINTGFSQSIALSSHTVYEPCKPTYQVTSSQLLPISQWTKLRYLQITGAPGVSQNNVLREIGNNCICLERLHLAHIGINVPPHFWDVLQHFKTLKDLRLEQPQLKLDERFFQSCLGCDKLQRLLIVAKYSKVELKVLENYIERARSLYMIQMFTDSLLKDCDRAHNVIQKRFEVERPGFLSVVEPIYHERVPYVVAALPLHHLEEMTILSSKVCSKPIQTD